MNPNPKEDRECGSCKSPDPIVLHNVPYRGSFALLCTACVLRHNVGSYCPLCFVVYEDAPAASKRPVDESLFMCHSCPAMAHLDCIPSARSSSTFRFICPQCSDPCFKFFDLGDSLSSKEIGRRLGSMKFSKQLLCAAKISSSSMRRAATIARSNAEVKVREAMAARNRAKEAIERVARLMNDEQAAQEASDMDVDEEEEVEEESSG